ncbi:MAG: 50S ribosomal protein L15 [Candidatus Doudnabacteria bacterium]|nr:50S ribosomal protein L15 [Candidatus Doudnabacteria bacterium]
MLKLHQLKKHPKSTHRRKVVGRGLGSGHGTYSTRGGKGQTARTGHSKMPANFEGGRQPLVRQMPKLRGFRPLAVRPLALSLAKLNVFSDNDKVDLKALTDKGLVDKSVQKIKILKGEIKKKLTVNLPVSASAKAAIEKAGGKII